MCSKIKKSIKFNQIIILESTVHPGATKEFDDDRKSPSYELIKILKNKKIKFDYHDLYFTKIRKGSNIKENKYSINLSKNKLMKYDATILLTDHSFFN